MKWITYWLARLLRVERVNVKRHVPMNRYGQTITWLRRMR